MSAELDVAYNGGSQRRARREIGGELAALAAHQHGVVERGQLLALGLTARQVHYSIRSGGLHRIHRGVYAVGHRRLTQQGRWMAAVLLGGPGTVLSHRSAGIHWQLLSPTPSLPDITTPPGRRKRPGIRLHTAALASDEITVRDGIPVTTVARTILDLAGCVDPFRLERAIAEAEFHRYDDSPSLPELIERHRGRRGIAALRRVLAEGDWAKGVARSPLEERFLRFLDERGLERPELNAPLRLGDDVIAVDCLWRRQRLAVELDGRAAHLRARTWEADRVRDRRLLASGWRPMRVTSEQLDGDGDRLEGDLRALGLGRPRGRDRLRHRSMSSSPKA